MNIAVRKPLNTINVGLGPRKLVCTEGNCRKVNVSVGEMEVFH